MNDTEKKNSSYELESFQLSEKGGLSHLELSLILRKLLRHPNYAFFYTPILNFSIVASNWCESLPGRILKKAVSFGEQIIIKDRYPSVTSNTEAMKVITEDIAVSCNSWKTFIHRELTMREFLSYLPEDLKVWKWMIMITK